MSYPTLPALRRLTRDLRLALRADGRTQGLPQLRFPRPQASNTGGHCIAIARLARGVDVELWLDLYSGLPSPRTWVGFRSTSKERIGRLAALASSVGLGDVMISRSTRDAHRRRRIWQFKNPLLPKEFDVQVLEDYGDNFFLGLYMPYAWPLSHKSENAIVRESANYIAAFMTAYTSAVPAKSRAVGPWNRPDKTVENAAIRCVKTKLQRAGYKVHSREGEICGYDLHATRDSQELHVEVKGVSGDSCNFHISRTELNTAEQDPDWRLAVVLYARVQPRLGFYMPGKHVKHLFHLEPTQWFATKRPQSKNQRRRRATDFR